MSDPRSSFTIRPVFRRRLDQLGIGLAGLCVIHCLLTLSLVSALGVGSHFLSNPDIHRVGLLLATVIAAAAIGWGAIRHRRRAPVVTATLGLCLMAAAVVVPHGVQEFALTLTGVALVSAGHLLNLRALR